MSFHNPINIVGMANILADDNDDINIDEIEKSIVTGIMPQKRSTDVSIEQEYNKEIADLNRKFELGLPSDVKKNNIFGMDNEDPVSLDDLLNLSNNTPNRHETQHTTSVSQSYKAPYNLTDDSDDKITIPRREWSPSRPDDEHLKSLTTEERKQTHVNQVLHGIDRNNDDVEFIQQEDEEDEMAKIIEQVDGLRQYLEADGADLSRIPEITPTTTKKEARSILRILQIKNDRMRYCEFFEEGILAAAYGLETIFNGQREILGSKIDLTGYSDTVKIKLRRMRYDTSNFVSGIMKNYNIGSGWRIILEIAPSLLLYTRDRRITSAKDNLMSDADYKKALLDIS